ncbi:MAG: hypothetical protein LUG12_04485 [Erysipelotrichaceae bacterium]|nr:hypothetical protein [Erysipelotrichaceae bacterium]
MDIKEINIKANEIYERYQSQIIPEYFYVGYMGLLAQYLQSGLFSFFVSLFLCPISHGYVKCAMKLVDEDDTVISYKESLVGILKFPHVAPAYLLRKGITILIILIVGIPALLSIRSVVPELSIEWFSMLGEAFIQTEFLLPDIVGFISLFDSPIVLIDIAACVCVYLYLSALFMPVPYVMELEEFSCIECISYSLRLMKGHMIDYINMYISYFLRYMSYLLIVELLLVIGSFNAIFELFIMVGSLFIYIYIFKGRYEISKYLFYQKIRGEIYE